MSDSEKKVNVTIVHTSPKISEEDYDKITFKVSIKIFVALSVLVTLFSGILGYGIYTLSREKATEIVKGYVGSDQFKEYVNKTFSAQSNVINDKIKEIDKSMGKLAIYEAAPYKISDNALTAVDAKGEHVFIEYGMNSAVSNQKILFKNKFEKPPVVVVTPIKEILVEDRPIHITSVTTTYFTVKYSASVPVNMNWIAIGK